MTFDALRHATGEYHSRAEESPAMRLLMSGSLDRASYAGILKAIFRIVCGFEETLLLDAPQIAARFSYAERMKTPFLTQDLQFMNEEVPFESECGRPWRLARPEAAVGALYVMEGATLGGRFVRDHVARVLNLEPPRGVAYFHSYGSERGRMWKAYRDRASDMIASDGWDSAAMIDAARDTFDRYTEAMHGA